MSAGQAAALGIGIFAVLSAVAVFTLAWRREQIARRVGKPDKGMTRTSITRPKLTLVGAGGAVAEAEPAIAEEEAPAEPARPAQQELSETEFGATRRMFLNRSVGAAFGAFMGFFAVTSLAFMWPRLRGGFGGRIDAGNVDDIRAALFTPEGRIEPFYVAEAKTYVMPFDESLVAGSDFEGLGVVAGGLVGLFQKCVHLGCRVPWCASSQGFECPCHGSKYNAHGEYEAGPAPRNLDRFVLEIDERNHLIINTGAVRDTARAKDKTVGYPQGVSCI
jgi:cytochrome b6-f complex iron-sulfur subunit